MKLRTGKRASPRRIVIYGEHGVGKSSLAAQAPRAVFIDIEGGLDDIDCVSFERAHTLADVKACIMEADGIDGVRWLVIDSADWLESLIWQDLCGPSDTILTYGGGFGKGYLAAAQRFESVLNALDGLRAKGIGVIILAHAKIARFESPEGPAYDRFQPALHDRAAAMLLEWADEVMFAFAKVYVKKDEQSHFGKERAVAIGGRERYLRCANSATCVAKNRLGLPDEIPMTWAAYSAYLPKLEPMTPTVPVVETPHEPTATEIEAEAVFG